MIARVDGHEGWDRVLGSYASQTLPASAFELVVVDTPGMDPAPSVFAAFRRAHPGVHLRRTRVPSHSRGAANNQGARQARGRWLAFVADDIQLNADALKAYLEFHRAHDNTADWAVGPIRFPSGLRDTAFRRWIEDSGRLLGVSWTDPPRQFPADFFCVANVSISKAAFTRAGGFRERFPGAMWDDFEFGLRLARAGGRAHCVPSARGLHLHAITLEERRRTIELAGRLAHGLESAPRRWPWERRQTWPAWIWSGAVWTAAALRRVLPSAWSRPLFFRAVLAEAFARGTRSPMPLLAEGAGLRGAEPRRSRRRRSRLSA